MKRNAFGEYIFTPADSDLAETFFEEFGVEPADVELEAILFEEDPNFAWCCTVTDQDGHEIQVHDFQTEGALLEWLTDNGVTVG